MIDSASPTDFPELTKAHLRPRRRRIRLPVILFVITCFSTFWVGTADWEPARFLSSSQLGIRAAILMHWQQGLIYMGCLLAILLSHEMGHFLATVRYRIPASLPYFIPFPIALIGTMGAVIGMDGLRANRKEMFDIGLAGPIAGLLVAVPVLWIGVGRLDLTQPPAASSTAVESPLLVNILMQIRQPQGYEENLAAQKGLAAAEMNQQWWHGQTIWTSQLNPYFMAGWVGMLITGLNMLPISQLDGGHVIYTLFGKRAHWIARAFLFCAIVFVVFGEAQIWMPMLIIVTMIGTDHPPTSDDSVSLGPVRTALGYASLLIPILCFPPYGLTLRPGM